MDEADQAYVFSERYLQGAIVENAKKLRPAVGRIFCDECGEEIPLARREAMPGCIRCVECQTEFENGGID